MSHLEDHLSLAGEKSPKEPPSLFSILLPLLLGFCASTAAGLRVLGLSSWLFGGPPHGWQGYVLLIIVLTPMMLAVLITEWRLTKGHR
jgi:hypothetical protein